MSDPDTEIGGALSGINVRRAGDTGPLVVCLHCSASHSGQFKPYFEALSDRFRLVAPDLHGYGRSRALPGDGQPWYAHDAGIVAALVAAEAPAKVHVVGHSLGGATAFYAARKLGSDRLASLTMIEPVLFGLLDEAGDPLALDGAGSGAQVAGYLRLGRADLAARSFVEFWSGPGAWDALPEDTRAYVTAVIPRVADDWAGMLPWLPEQASIADCAALNMPVQLIRGSATRASAAAIIDLLHRAMPWATLAELDGADHMAAVTQPTEFIAQIDTFLTRHRTA